MGRKKDKWTNRGLVRKNNTGAECGVDKEGNTAAER